MIGAYRRRRWLRRLVNRLVGWWRLATPWVARGPCPLAGRCSATALAEARARGIRAVPGIVRRMHRCQPPRAARREALIGALWLVIRKPRSDRARRVQLRLARWALSWAEWAERQAGEWAIQLEDMGPERGPARSGRKTGGGAS